MDLASALHRPRSNCIPTHPASSFVVWIALQDENWEVEFEIGHDDDGKVKAVEVTAPGGGPCTGPRRPRKPRKEREGGSKTRGPAKPKEPHWHESLVDSVKGLLEEKGVRTATGTLDLSVGDARVKLGTNGYSSMAHADGILAEGTFACDADGNATFTWEHCLAYDKAAGEWKGHEAGTYPIADKPELPAAFCLADGEFL